MEYADYKNTVSKKINRTGIPDKMKKSFEIFSGFSFDDVKVHYNSQKPAQLKALAYTQGNKVYIAPCEEKHLSHELGHVVQQKQGRVNSGVNINGIKVNMSRQLESDANTISINALNTGNTINSVSYFDNHKTSEIIQKQPDNEPAMTYEDFASKLIEIIGGHIDNSTNKVEELSEELWIDIKKKFSTPENKQMIISKILSFTPQSVGMTQNNNNVKSIYKIYYDDEQNQKKQIKKEVTTAFQGLQKPIEETLNDIGFWMHNKRAKDITEITLTDSDIHSRGVGVCIVDYSDNEGAFQKLVIKPENKSFEKLVYGNEDTSLANNFNKLLKDGILGEEYKNTSIGTLAIDTSDNYGSAIEFFEHQRYNELQDKNDVNKQSVAATIAFASLLGLADLHVENSVYSKSKNPVMQLIDAEIGMKYNLIPNNPLMTATDRGEMYNRSSTEINSIDQSVKNIELNSYNPDLIKQFLENIRTDLKDFKSRIVLIDTPLLFQYRGFYLGNMYTETDDKNYYTTLTDRINNYFVEKTIKAEIAEQTICTNAARKDFSLGRIPFFELTFKDGKVTQKTAEGNVHIATFKGNDDTEFLDKMIDERLKILFHEYERQHPLPPAQTGNNKMLKYIGIIGLIAAAYAVNKLIEYFSSHKQ